jgi:uncharacterized protein DUF5615
MSVRDFLMGHGHSVIRAVDVNLGGQEDLSVAVYAVHEGRAVVTGNRRHFKLLIVRVEGLRVVTFNRTDQGRFAEALAATHDQVVDRLANGDRWILLRQISVGKRRQIIWTAAAEA